MNNNGTIGENQTMLGIVHLEGDATPSATTAINESVTNSLDPINNEIVQIIFCILYSTVFVLGVFGNVLVCYVVLRNRAMQTVTNIFITNLALSDILLCGLAVPFTPLYTFMGRWAFGRTLCHLVPFAQGCSIYISTLTLTSIAIDRYFVIIYPFKPRMRLSTCIAIIISIWVISLLATLPYGLFVKVLPDAAEAADTITYCEENWPSEKYRKVFGSVTTILQFVLPFIIISICYTWVSFKLNARAKAKPGSKSSRREEADRDRKKRTNRMLISMVAVFGLSWLPINLVNIFGDFYEKSDEWGFYTLLFFVAHSVAMSSTCYNPFLYAWLNENFRKEFKHVLPCFNPSSNNNIFHITRGYNRSDRTAGGGGSGNARQSVDNENVFTQDVIIPREPTYGGSGLPTKMAQNCVQIRLNENQIQDEEPTVEVRFLETPFMSSDTTATSQSTIINDSIICDPSDAHQN